jgi:ketosteroid isomerase-like protein
MMPRRDAVPSPDAHRAAIGRYLAAYNSFDVPAMLAELHPDVVFRNVSGGAVTASAHGREEFRALAEHAATLFRSRRQTVVEAGSDGDRAWVTVDFEGVLAADLGPGLRVGETLRLTGRSTFAFRDGLIVELVDES